MRLLLPLLVLLVAPALDAAPYEAAQPGLTMNPAVTAHVAGTGPSARTRGSEVLVFDSFTNATSYTTTGATPRTFMGMPFNLGAAGGPTPAITSAVVYVAHAGSAPATINRLAVRLQFWDNWSSVSDPVFSTPAGALIVATLNTPLTLPANSFTPITVPFNTPVTLDSRANNGYSLNFQVDTGSGLVSSEDFTSLIRYGSAPITLGSNAAPDFYGYRNTTGRTDFNFNANDARALGQANEGLAIQLYATPTTLISQTISNFVATPANPLLIDGTFSVSATGGASGNPVTFSISSASASVCTAGGSNGATITMLSLGNCTIRANQAGNATYNDADEQSLNVTITNPAQLVEDGSFEAGASSPYWAASSSNFGAPICDAGCGGFVGPRSGLYWVWFGGTMNAETASLEQTAQLAPGPQRLTFYLRWSSALSPPPDATARFTVKIDGTTLFTLTPATAAAYNAAYTPVSLDVSAFADGNNHTLRFDYSNASADAFTDVHLDDISIVSDRIFANGFQ